MIENITLGQLAVGLAFLVGLAVSINTATKPIRDFNKRVDDIEKHQDNDNKRLIKLEGDTKQILLSVNVLLSHNIDNNHSKELADRKRELDDYLIKR